MGPYEDSDTKYLLLFKKNISSSCWLYPCNSADSNAATNDIAKWIGFFGWMYWIIADRGAEFTADLMANHIDNAQVSDHFTTLQCSWANGKIERLCREVIKTVLALLSEWKLPSTHWPCIIEALQKTINRFRFNTIDRNDHGTLKCPLEVFAGLKRQPLTICPTPLRKYRDLA